MPLSTALTLRQFQVLEKQLISKQGLTTGGEDRLVHTVHAIGVIDGATDTNRRNWSITSEHFESSGSFLADCIVAALTKSGRPEFFLADINQQVQMRAIRLGINLEDPASRPQASFCLYLPALQAVLQIGDCQLGIIDQQGNLTKHDYSKKVDLLTADIRSTEIKRLLAAGIDPFANGQDLGREKILPLIKRQSELRNPTAEARAKLGNTVWAEGVTYQELFYSVIDGVSLPTCRLIKLPADTKEIVVCSDGYPELCKTLAESEEKLRQILAADPHAYLEFPSTKGLQPGQISFDDRSYLRLAANLYID